MSFLPSIFVISLPGSSRRPIIQQRLQSQGIQFSFWDAVNGAELEDKELRKVDQRRALYEWGHELSNGEIGCALSHISIYEHMKKQDLKEAIILEDDSDPVEQFLETIHSMLKKRPGRAELIYLYHGKAKSWPIKKKLNSNFKLARYRYPSAKSKRTIISTRGYWININGATKILKQAYPVRMPSDYLLGYIQHSGIHAYGIEPNCLKETFFESEIDRICRRNYGGHSNGL